MEIESLTNRFIPEDAKEKAGRIAQSIIDFLKDQGYYDILIAYQEEHTDKVVEDEQISYVFHTVMKKEKLDMILGHIMMDRKNFKD